MIKPSEFSSPVTAATTNVSNKYKAVFCDYIILLIFISQKTFLKKSNLVKFNISHERVIQVFALNDLSHFIDGSEAIVIDANDGNDF